MTGSLILDDGWLISSALLSRADRPYALSVVVSAAGDARSAEEFAAADRAALQSSPGYEPGPTAAIELEGAQIAVHRYRWSQNGGPPTQQARFYRVLGGIAYSMTASQAPPEQDEREIAELLAGLRIDPRPPVDLSEDELAAIAQLAGIPAFPGLEGREAPAEAALLAARRALVARGTLRPAPQGGLALEPQTGALVHTVLTAPGMIATERRASHGTEACLVHLGPEVGVRQHEVAPGIQRLQPFAPAALPLVIAGTLRLADGPAAQSAPVRISSAAYRALREHGTPPPDAPALAAALKSPAAALTVRVLRREGRKVVGGELALIDAGASGVWAIEARDESVTLSPVDASGVMRRIADRLAGGQSAAT